MSPSRQIEVHILNPSEVPVTDGPPEPIWSAAGSIDTDLVSTAWSRRYRPEDLSEVSGPWGVLLWDPTTREHVLATDPVGVLPLFWARTEDARIVIGPWLAEVLNVPGVSDDLDYEGVLLDEAQGTTAEEILHRTRFESVQRVPWGRVLRIRPDGSTRLQKYWHPDRFAAPDNSLTLADCADLLHERIDSAIRRLLPEGARIGSHVSGGLDCTAVACRANQILNERGSELTAGYSWTPTEEHVPRFEGDERGLLEDVENQEGFKIRRVHPDESGDWFWARDPNRYAQSTHNRERFVLPNAQSDGIGIMLSGWGGDELSSFNGRAVIPYLVRQGRFGHVWRLGRQKRQVQRPGASSGTLRHLASALLQGAPSRARDVVEYLRDREGYREGSEQEARIHAALHAYSPTAARIRQERNTAFNSCTDPNQFRLLLLTGGHIQHRTGWWYQTGRLFDLHYRYPLLDARVVEAALRLPWWAFRSLGWSRIAYRTAVSDWVPQSVAWNTAKYEPALFWPEHTNPIQRKQPPARPSVDLSKDTRYRESMKLVALTYTRRGTPISTDSRVTSRPEAAPVVDVRHNKPAPAHHRS